MYSILITDQIKNYLLKDVSFKKAYNFVLYHLKTHYNIAGSLKVEHNNEIFIATEFFNISNKIQQGESIIVVR